jgi:hypothetical protein
MNYEHLTRWTMPKNYFGDTWADYYGSGVGQSRDSDALERSNFAAMLAMLGGEAIAGPDTYLVAVVHENHWAVGWVEWIAIHKSNPDMLAIADKTMASLEDYPIIDEDLYSEYESDECDETWSNCYDPRQRLNYLKSHADIQYHNWRDTRAACAGDWWAAANILPCPNELIY